MKSRAGREKDSLPGSGNTVNSLTACDFLSKRLTGSQRMCLCVCVCARQSSRLLFPPVTSQERRILFGGYFSAPRASTF